MLGSAPSSKVGSAKYPRDLPDNRISFGQKTPHAGYHNTNGNILFCIYYMAAVNLTGGGPLGVKASEDVGLLRFDADKDGDLDLY